MPPASRRDCLCRTSGPAAHDADCRAALLLQLFEAQGGIADGDQLVRLLLADAAQPISTVARWIVSRQIVCFAWREQILIPLFQFDFEAGTVRPAVSRVVEELKSALDDLALANWFATPSLCLGGDPPAARIHGDHAAVLDVARACRFALRG